MLLRYVFGFVAFALVMCFSLVAFGVDPASQPATQPAAVNAAWAWCKANWPWIAGALIIALPGLITALSKYPKAGGVVKALQVLLDWISVLTHKDSPNTVKLPFTKSKPPEKK